MHVKISKECWIRYSILDYKVKMKKIEKTRNVKNEGDHRLDTGK